MLKFVIEINYFIYWWWFSQIFNLSFKVSINSRLRNVFIYFKLFLRIKYVNNWIIRNNSANPIQKFVQCVANQDEPKPTQTTQKQGPIILCYVIEKRESESDAMPDKYITTHCRICCPEILFWWPSPVCPLSGDKTKSIYRSGPFTDPCWNVSNG